MNENETPKPQNIVADTLIGIGEVIVRAFSAVIEWAWETWKGYWGAILIVGFVVFVLYVITKPGWDEVAAGRSFWLSQFDSRNRIVQDCLKSEFGYTREECIQLAGGGKIK